MENRLHPDRAKLEVQDAPKYQNYEQQSKLQSQASFEKFCIMADLGDPAKFQDELRRTDRRKTDKMNMIDVLQVSKIQESPLNEAGEKLLLLQDDEDITPKIDIKTALKIDKVKLSQMQRFPTFDNFNVLLDEEEPNPSVG
jgi:tetraacyldisaccharide-1-P 4'-kinase